MVFNDGSNVYLNHSSLKHPWAGTVLGTEFDGDKAGLVKCQTNHGFTTEWNDVVWWNANALNLA